MKAQWKMLIIGLLASAHGIAGALGASKELTDAIAVIATVLAGLLKSPIAMPPPSDDLKDLK